MPQENGLLEMEGSVENIVYHNDSNQYTVLEVDCGEELITVVGTFPYVSVGERLHLYGTWTSHATFGQQFRTQAFERSRPADTAAMLKYLSSGAVKGIGGALAGLGASLLYQTGYEQWQCTYSSVPSMGFNGIAAAFLGGLSPIGSIFASFFIQHITAGGAYVDKSLYCSQISDLISAIIIYLCSFVLFFKTVLSSWIARHEEKKARKAAQAAGKGGEQA